MGATTYSVRCSCNLSHEVSATQAGSEIDCACGRRVPVPPLSVLRQQAGESAYATPTSELIDFQYRAGDLPPRGRCAACGQVTHDTLDIYVECERSKVTEIVPRYWYVTQSLLFLFCWWVFLFRFLQQAFINRPLKETGRDTVVRTPLCIDSQCAVQVHRKTQTQLRQLLCSVPIYEQLLQEYPYAKVIVPRD